MRYWKAWSQFWFGPVPLLNLGVFRFIFCSTLGFMYLSRQADVSLYFSDSGILPKNLALAVLPEFYRPSFLIASWPDSWAWGIHLFFVIGLFLLALGFGGRFLAGILAVLQLAFLQRNFAISFGADQIGALFLLYLALTKSCDGFSLKRAFSSKAPKQKDKSFVSGLIHEISTIQSDWLTSIGYRLIQIQLCVIYAFSGFEKLKGTTWWDGTALWTVLANPQMVVMDFSWVRVIPWIVVAFAFSTILFEIYFPVLVWFRKCRTPLLMIGVSFHIGIAAVMALFSFAMVMMAPYVLFVKEESLRSFCLKLRQKARD